MSGSDTAPDAEEPQRRARPTLTTTQRVLPYAAFGAALAFLGASGLLGYRIALTRSSKPDAAVAGRTQGSTALPREEVDARSLLAKELPTGGRAGVVAVKALGYGTLLCLTGATVVSLATGWALGVNDMDGFARAMERHMPAVRHALEGALSPLLTSVSSSAQRVVQSAAPSAHASTTPAAAVVGDDDAYLTPRDRQVMEEVKRFMQQEEADAAAKQQQMR